MKPTVQFMTCWVLAVAWWPGIELSVSGQGRSSFLAARRQMVNEAVIEAGVKDQRVIQAMLDTPRHEFVPRAQRRLAYEDMALPIGNKQTISSPFIVAFMTETLDPQPTDRVLEIGTGSGYQAAILSSLVKDVYTIEIVESLGRTAQRTLKRLHYRNVHTKIGDGFKGWPEHAPFDKIIVTCSPEKVPDALVSQLREGGLVVVPVGQRYQQTLYLMRKHHGKLETEALRPTLFVPMTGAAEQARSVKPDPANPKLSNEGFEEKLLESGFVPGWYYQRQSQRVAAEDAPEGEHYLVLKNLEPGKRALAMQGIPIDGRRVARLRVSAWVRYDGVRPGRDNDELPAILITFLDANRKPLGDRWIGPFQGTRSWYQKREVLRVPAAAREGLVRIGMFGAVGEVAFDRVQIEAVRKSP